MIGPEFARLWRKVMTDRKFRTPEGGSVSYATGQPMGFDSSWPFLALWHNVILRTAHSLSGVKRIKGQPSFLVIGDDVTTRGALLNKAYRELLDLQDVPVSESKGFQMETIDPSNPLNKESKSHSAEMAKCIVRDGIQISTVSPATLKMSQEHPSNFTALFRELETRSHSTLSLESMEILANLNYKPR
jgi:hypothetical protein